MDSIINSCKCSVLNPQIANNDIICYKVIRRDNKNNLCYDLIENKQYFPNTNQTIISGTLMQANGKTIYNNWFKHYILRKPAYEYISEYIKWNEVNKWFDITYGYLHALPYIPNDSQDMKNYCPLYTAGHFELWQCVIPKGTKYYQADRRGSHWESCNSYAAKQLKFVKKLNECDYKGWWFE